MRNDAELIYLKRKVGIGNSLRYKLSSFTPLLIIMIITAVLVFSITFIFSMSDAIENAIIYLGSGAVYSSEYVDPALYPEVGYESFVSKTEGIIYSENGEGLVYLKGIDSTYFTDERRNALHLEPGLSNSEKGILISQTLAESLNLNIGDRLTLLLYEEEKNRTRPHLLSVTGIFDSGYVQLDRYLAFVDISLLEGAEGGYEIILKDNKSAASFASSLRSSGYDASSFDQLYSSLYGNVRNSIAILYLIFALVAILAAFFSSDASHAYVARDARDIAAMMLLGLSENRIRKMYLKLTLFFILIAVLIGSSAGIVLSMRIPHLIKLIAEENSSLLEYYITSFSVSIPLKSIAAIIVVMLFVSAITVFISLFSIKSKDINTLVKGE